MKSKLLTLLYYLLLAPLYLLALPYLFYLSTKSKYKDSIPARFFLKNNPPFKNSDIWFHACSLGEVKSLEFLISQIDSNISLSTTTNTGFGEAKKKYEDVRFLPFELFLPFWVKKHKVVVVLEAELWLMLFFSAKLKGAKTILLNARIHDGSYEKYLKLRWFYELIFSYIDIVLAQSEVDKDRLEKLGAKRVEVVGNIKTFGKIEATKEYRKPSLRVITIASTHENEEQMILKNIKFRDGDKILIAPRHPERFDEVEVLAKEFAFRFSKSFGRFSTSRFDSDVVLIDAMGELINIYKISDIVILGGSFITDEGGHNPIEPAAFGCTIISGEYIFETKSLYEAVENIYFCDYDGIDTLLAQKSLKKSLLKSKDNLKRVLDTICQH